MNSRNNEMEIDLLELFRVWKKKLWLIILVTFLGGTVGFAFSKIALTPMYTSTSMMYAVSKETTLTSLADLQIGSQLTQDYKVIITSRPVLEEVIGDLDLNISYEILKSKISINNPADTRILAITATDPDPQMAKAIVDRTASVSSGYIGDIMEMIPPKIIEEGQVPTQKSVPATPESGAGSSSWPGTYLWNHSHADDPERHDPDRRGCGAVSGSDGPCIRSQEK